MKCFSNYFTFILSVVFLSGCAEKLEIEHEHVPEISVSGFISDLDTSHIVSIQYGATIQNPVTVAYNTAVVQIESNQGEVVSYSYIGNGKYMLPSGSLDVKIGNEYRIFLTLDGEEYASEWQEMKPVIPINSLSSKKNEEKDFCLS